MALEMVTILTKGKNKKDKDIVWSIQKYIAVLVLSAKTQGVKLRITLNKYEI